VAETRRLAVPIPGVEVAIAGGVLHVHSARPLAIVSSAPCGGGWLVARDVLNAHVSRDYRSDRPEADLRALAARLGVAEPFVGLLTAADVERAGAAGRATRDLAVACVATAGLSNATAAGLETPWEAPALAPDGHGSGTINLIVLADADLTPEAMVNLVSTVTEAKTMTLVERDVRTSAGERASGTSTDTVVVACTGSGPRLRYAGPATLAGHFAAQCVRAALAAALGAEGYS